MQSIKAFIGYSFGEDDKHLVRIFLDHFGNVAKALPNFSWDHAEEAEPLSLAQKVLTKIEDKNVFIGICTGKERVIAPGSLTSTLFNNGLKGIEADFHWKTSDWIIQEIGLAIGRKMSLVLFLEEGVRVPGGLYGDIEYISFSRDRPHECFDKFLQMLTSLSPRGASAPAPESTQGPAEENSEPESQGESLDPQLDWDEGKYEHNALRAVLRRNEDQLKKIDAAFKSTSFARGDGLAAWEAQIEYMRLLFWDSGNFANIKRIASENPTSSKVIFYLARGYEELKEHTTAAEKFEDAARLATDDEDKAKILAIAATEHARAGAVDRALETIERAKELAIKTPDGVLNAVVPSLRQFAEVEKNNDLELALLEQSAADEPGNVRVRFSLAFKHSECENGDMALHHYLKIPMLQRDATTWNNLGVCFDQFKMPTKTVSAYRRSEAEDQTLAMSNLGFKFLQAGFIDEARKQCERALKLESPHKNIGLLMGRLDEVTDEEEKKLAEVLEKVKGKAAFYRRLGEAALQRAPTTIFPKWESPDGIFDATISGSAFRLFGTFERSNALANALLGTLTGLQQTYLQKVEYKGQLRGQMIFGTVAKTHEGGRPTTLAEGVSGDTKVLMYFESPSELRVIEHPHSFSPRFYAIKQRLNLPE
jgi:tetratricopeptide (TPR) repeat protein